jgi:hypothetical protein
MRLRPAHTWFSILLCALLAAFAAGCSTTSEDAYNKQVSDAHAAYESGKISMAEYLKLKEEAQNAYMQRQSNN